MHGEWENFDNLTFNRFVLELISSSKILLALVAAVGQEILASWVRHSRLVDEDQITFSPERVLT